MERENFQKIALSSYSSYRRRIRQSVANSWQQILAASSETIRVEPIQDIDQNNVGLSSEPVITAMNVIVNEIVYEDSFANVGNSGDSDMSDVGINEADVHFISDSDSDAEEYDDIKDDTSIGEN
jgi:hypothetical protein